MKLLTLLSFLFFACAGITQSQQNTSGEALTTSHPVRKALEQFLADRDLRGASVAFYAYNIQTRQVLADINADQLLLPASVLKLLTSITAMEVLSPDYRIRTDVFLDGVKQDTLFKGNIVIRGYGDPTIGSELPSFQHTFSSFCHQLVQSLQKQHISSIEGMLIADARVFGPLLQSPGYVWEDLGNYYGAGASSLNFAENKLRLEFSSGKEQGVPATFVGAQQHPMNIQWISQVTTADVNSGDNVYVYGVPFQSVRYMVGTIPSRRQSFFVWASDPDPALRFADNCRECLMQQSILFNGDVKAVYDGGIIYDSSRVLMRYYSPKLSEILTEVNKKSHNVFAESIFRHIGWNLAGTAEWRQVADVVLNYWKEKGMDVAGLIVHDGSGLSRTNRLTAKFVVDLLVYATRQSWFQVFYQMLAIAGVDGTLQNVFKGGVLENNMRAKSGSMRGVRAYAGFIKNSQNQLIAFCFIVNGHSISSRQIVSKMENVLNRLVQ